MAEVVAGAFDIGTFCAMTLFGCFDITEWVKLFIYFKDHK